MYAFGNYWGKIRVMARKNVRTCPIETLLKLIGNKWKILILRDLLGGKKRFGELRKTTGASQKVLTSNLRELESDELLVRVAYAEIPPRVEYSLTDLGMSLAPVLDVMAEWGEDYQRYCDLKAKRSAQRG